MAGVTPRDAPSKMMWSHSHSYGHPSVPNGPTLPSTQPSPPPGVHREGPGAEGPACPGSHGRDHKGPGWAASAPRKATTLHGPSITCPVPGVRGASRPEERPPA